MKKIRFRKNIRLKNYDYLTNGYYFVTITTHNRLPLLKNCSGECELAIRNLPKFIKGLSIDYFVVMNNHIHIIFIFENCSRPLGRVVSALKSAITKIVAANANSQFVAANVNSQFIAAGASPQNSIITINQQKQVDLEQPLQVDLHQPLQGDLHRPLQVWQLNYYEHVIRNEKALFNIREYIQNNPEKEFIDFKQFYEG